MKFDRRKSNRKRKRLMGFLARKKTRGGRAIIRRQRKRRGKLNT
ncbi:MAG: 50S ribosomal protein L34 [Planctomycetota bacterium]|nr:MAG: 50S ribosomal protein L34 [Planctomycetota bacterium]